MRLHCRCIHITNLSHLCWTWIISDKPLKKDLLCFFICLLSQRCEARWVYSSLFSFVTTVFDLLGMRSVAFITPSSEGVSASRTQWEVSHTICSNSKVQHQIFRIAVVVLQENQAIIGFWSDARSSRKLWHPSHCRLRSVLNVSWTTLHHRPQPFKCMSDNREAKNVNYFTLLTCIFHFLVPLEPQTNGSNRELQDP